jgi:hypothetical protein
MHDPEHLDDAAMAERGLPVSPSPVAPADIGSASRSCLAILLLGAAIVVLVCVSLAVRLVS